MPDHPISPEADVVKPTAHGPGSDITKELWPFHGAMCFALLLVLPPALSLWLPGVVLR